MNILLVEDDEVDIMNVRRAFHKNHVSHRLHIARDGLEALNLLFNGEIAPLPSVILLDINMPRMNGLEFLKHLRNDPVLKKISVFILSTSCEDHDKHGAYELNVAGYIHKPVDNEAFNRTMVTLNDFWNMVEFPDLNAARP